MHFPSQTEHSVIPLQEIAALQARLVPEQNSPSNSSDDTWSESGNSSPSRNDLTSNNDYDEHQPLHPVYSSYFDVDYNLTVCWVYSKVISMSVTVNSDSALQTSVRQQQHDHSGIRYSFKQFLTVKVAKHNEYGSFIDFAHPSLLYQRSNKNSEMTFPLVDVLKPTNKVKLKFYLAHTCPKENCSSFSIWLGVDGNCPHCHQTCNLITPQQVTNTFLVKSKTNIQVLKRTQKNKKPSGSAGDLTPAVSQSTFAFTLNEPGESLVASAPLLDIASEDPSGLPWLNEKDPILPLPNNRYNVSHNLTGIWAYSKSMTLTISTISGATENIQLKVRKILRNRQSSGFCDDSILYKRKKNARPSLEPFSVSGVPQTISFYFSTTCQKMSCEYFALSILVLGPSGPMEEVSITNLFQVKSKSQEQNQKRIERESGKRKQHDEIRDDNNNKKQKLTQEEITQLMQLDDQYLSATTSSPDPGHGHRSPVSSPLGSDHNASPLQDLESDLSDNAHLVPSWVRRPSKSVMSTLDIDSSTNDALLLNNSHLWDAPEPDLTNDVFDITQFDLAALFPDLPLNTDIPPSNKPSEPVTYPQLYTPQAYPQSYPQVTYPSVPNTPSSGWTPSYTSSYPSYTSSFSAAPKSLYPTLDTTSTISSLTPSYNTSFPSISVPSLPSFRLPSAGAVLPSVLATLSTMAFKPFFGSSATPAIQPIPIPIQTEESNSNNNNEPTTNNAQFPFSQTNTDLHPLVAFPQQVDVMEAEVIEMGTIPMSVSEPESNAPNEKQNENNALQTDAPSPMDTDFFFRPNPLDINPSAPPSDLQPVTQPIPFTTPTYASAPTNVPWNLPVVPLQEMPPYTAPVAPQAAPKAKPKEDFVVIGKLFFLRFVVLATVLGSAIVQLAIKPPHEGLAGILALVFVLSDAFSTLLLTRHTKKSKSSQHLTISTRWLFMCSLISLPLAFISFAATHHLVNFLFFAVLFFQFSCSVHLRRWRKRNQNEWIMGEERFPLVGEV